MSGRRFGRRSPARGITRSDLAGDMEDYLMGRLGACGPDECWEYTGSRNVGGYGVVSNAGRGVVLAHRAAYALWVGEIPPGKCIMHSCDNPPCCNPKHLKLGSQKDNMVDKSTKLRGGVSPLGPDDVKKIRAAYDLLGYVPREMLRDLGIGYSSAQNIATRRTWAWLA